MSWPPLEYDGLLRDKEARGHTLTPKEESDVKLFKVIRYFERLGLAVLGKDKQRRIRDEDH